MNQNNLFRDEPYNNKERVKPVIRWNGGKSQLLQALYSRLPQKYNNFIDPFVGGGAFPFSTDGSHKIYISDICQPLINFYKRLAQDVYKMRNLAIEYEIVFVGAEGYKHLRYMYNNIIDENSFEKAAAFYMLNRRCFNGLYRVNKKGWFNVPYCGIDREASFSDATTLSKFLKNNCIIDLCDYTKTLRVINRGDFVFVDPPYIAERGGNEAFYGGNSINKLDQNVFLDYLKAIDAKGAYFMLTNNATNEAKNLFKCYNIETISVKKYFTPNGNDRSGRFEIIVKNY